MSIKMIWVLAAVGIVLVVLIVLILRYVMRRSYELAIINYQNKLLSQEMEEVRNVYMTMRGCHLKRKDFSGIKKRDSV